MLDKLTLDDFLPLVGSLFQIHYGGAQPLSVTLTEATSIPTSPHAPRTQAFSLILRSDGEMRHLNQGMIRLEHPQLTIDGLFIVPIGPDSIGMCYQVVFN